MLDYYHLNNFNLDQAVSSLEKFQAQGLATLECWLCQALDEY